ncbi:MAG: sigma-54-dependent Fis family transcriptional regulator [Deltaproteobacteria bacterium]|nr:sigma-54-dependent Fis family transcriptional regulator [Deltaproteobacteria bacterium]
MSKIALIEDTKSLRDALCAVLQESGFDVESFSNAEEALNAIKTQPFSLVLSDLKLPGLSGLEFVRIAKLQLPLIPIVVMTAFGSIEIAVQAMKLGAADFITKPFDPSMLCSLLRNLESSQNLNTLTSKNGTPSQPFITEDENTKLVLHQAAKVAPIKSPVMILGESGTGKELVARYIHEQSTRRDFPFIPICCGSIPADMLESELFGHEEGAFTGAFSKHIGLFESAHGGTIFLDEIANMPQALQMKLLRVLQDEEIRPLGSNSTRKIDVRIISSTHCNIAKAVEEKLIRHDLYYRLGVVILEIPPLRERKKDIELLANYFVKSLSVNEGKCSPALSKTALNALFSYSWPGNVRQLKNAIEQALVFTADDDIIKQINVESVISEATNEVLKLAERASAAAKKAEVESIKNALTKAHGNKTKAAKILGVSYKTLLNKIKSNQIKI